MTDPSKADSQAIVERLEKRLQCKDIPDLPILKFIASLNGRWGTWFWYEGIDVAPANTVRLAMPDGPSLPDRLVLAKMASLIRKGLVKGCPCGCRGDYTLTEAGRALAQGE